MAPALCSSALWSSVTAALRQRKQGSTDNRHGPKRLIRARSADAVFTGVDNVSQKFASRHCDAGKFNELSLVESSCRPQRATV